MLAHPGVAGAEAPQWTEKDKLARIASCSYPIRYIFKTRPGGGRAGGPGQPAATSPATGAPPAAAPPAGGGRGGQGNGGMTNAEMKEKYGEITMLDFPQFTKDTFPGVTHMDLFSGLFGDVTDDSMFVRAGRCGGSIRSSPSGRKWLDQLAASMVGTGTKVPAHLEQRADRTCDSAPDEAQRKAGVEIGKVARRLRGPRRRSRCA